MKYKQIGWMGNLGLLALMWLVGSVPVEAAENMRLFGTLISAPACIINNGQMIEVNFGDDLLTSKIDGVNYSKPIVYTLDCKEAGNKGVRMQIKGTAASFDNTVLATVERRNLGIVVKMEGVDHVLPINNWFNLSTNAAKPPLRAVPIKERGSELTPGSFSAGATLLFEYQ